MKKTGLIFFAVSVIGMFTSCMNSNECITEYKTNSEFNRKHIFSIDSSTKDCKYHTETLIFLNDTAISTKQFFHLNDNKFWVKLIEPSSDDFILFDFEAKPNESRKIEIKYSGKVKSFDCILERKIITKQNLEVYIYRIKNWVKYPFTLKDFEMDLKAFVTKENGVIGSYVTDIDSTGKEIMIAPAGEILKDYIDYSKIELNVIE